MQVGAGLPRWAAGADHSRRPFLSPRRHQKPVRGDRRSGIRTVACGHRGCPARVEVTMGALDGVLVVDFSTLVPGPLATLFLAEAGAEVIKIERPGTGDEMRSYDPRIDDESANFLLLNRGKKSIAL